MIKPNLNHWLKLIGIAFVFVAVFSILSPALTAFAQDTGAGLAIPGSENISSSIVKTSFADNVISMVNYFIGFLGFLATIAFVYAGVLWVVSGCNEDSIGKSKKIMLYAAGGIIVVILSYSIVSFIAGSAPVSETSSDWVSEAPGSDAFGVSGSAVGTCVCSVSSDDVSTVPVICVFVSVAASSRWASRARTLAGGVVLPFSTSSINNSTASSPWYSRSNTSGENSRAPSLALRSRLSKL